jgi:hypothetical protein
MTNRGQTCGCGIHFQRTQVSDLGFTQYAHLTRFLPAPPTKKKKKTENKNNNKNPPLNPILWVLFSHTLELVVLMISLGKAEGNPP